MISNQARDGFDRLLTRALKASLATSMEDACEVSVAGDVAAIDETGTVVLTVSSYLFRLMVMIHFTPDEATREHIGRMNGTPVADMGGQAFRDAIAECGNLCCGILNRDLGAFFPHIGMSTPNFIDRQCVSCLAMLGCGHIRHFAVAVDGVTLFHVSLCVSAYAELDFAVAENEESANTGELELF